MSTPSGAPTQSAGGRSAPSASTGPLAGDVLAAVQAVLAGEHAAVWAYAVVTARATDATSRSRALADLAAHRSSRDALEDLVSAGGSTPVAALPGYEVPGGSAAALAVLVEDRLATTYLDLVQTATSSAVIGVGGRGVRDCAVRAARWRGSSVPFPGR